MSRLDDIRDRLYRKTPNEPATPPRDSFRLPVSKPAKIAESWRIPSGDSANLPATPPMLKHRRISPWLWATIGAILLLGATAFIAYRIFFASADVSFEISGPGQIIAGEPTVFSVRVVNRGTEILSNGAVTLTLPAGTIAAEDPRVSAELHDRIPVPDLAPGADFATEVRVKVLGKLGEQKSVSGIYVYQPENLRSKLTRRAEFSATIVRVPLAIAIEAPERVRSGQELEVVIGIDSELSAPLAGTALIVDFPTGFEVRSSDPLPESGSENRWLLGELPQGTSRRIKIRGTIRGEPEETKAFHAAVGRYDAAAKSLFVIAEETSGPAIASPFLFAQSSVNGIRSGSVAPGGRLSGSVFFKNNISQKIQNLRITLSFPERFVELKSVRAERGFYDVSRRALVWNSSSEPRLEELDPGEEGTLAFSLDLKSSLPIQRFADKNFSLPITVTIETLSPPDEFRGVLLDYQDAIEFKIASPLRLAARANYYDSPVPNAGPLPPKVRETTTYTITLQLSSGSNDLSDVEVKARLGDNVTWLRSLLADIGAINFNEASGEITWKVGQLPAATGILRSLAAASFQVGFTPAENQIGSSPVIVRAITASGRDRFTETDQSDRAEDLTTELRTDSRSTGIEWRVAP